MTGHPLHAHPGPADHERRRRGWVLCGHSCGHPGHSWAAVGLAAFLSPPAVDRQLPAMVIHERAFGTVAVSAKPLRAPRRLVAWLSGRALGYRPGHSGPGRVRGILLVKTPRNSPEVRYYGGKGNTPENSDAGQEQRIQCPPRTSAATSV